MTELKYELRETNAIRVVFASAETPVDEFGVSIPRLLEEVSLALSKSGQSPAGPPFCRYTDWQETVCTVDAGVPIAGDFTDDSTVKSGTLGGTGTCLCVTYTGSYDGLHATYGAAERWMAENAYTWNGDPWDSYVVGPATERDPSRWQTDIYIPVRKI